MNNVKTRFVIAISQKLTGAPDSDAKVDLIEELSENLTGRYEDMTAAGMPAEEAYQKALGELGDVNELLAYLDSFSGSGQTEVETSQDSARDSSQDTHQSDDWFRSLGGFVRQAVDQAADAANDAASIIRSATDKLWGASDKTRDGGAVRIIVNGESVNTGRERVFLRTDDNDELEFPSSGLREIRVKIVGDLSVYLNDDPESLIWLRGDIDDLQVEIDNGVFTATQGKTAGGNFLFSRGMSSASIELTIPRRHWDKIDLTTTSGDMELCDRQLDVDELRLNTASGDMEVGTLCHTRRLEVNTASGDLELDGGICDELVFRSASGDLSADNLTAAVDAQTASGDVTLSGSIRALRASTASGDVELETDFLPETVEMTSKSGDCSLSIPDNEGFIFRFSTISGSLSSDFPLTTAAGARQSRGGRCAEAYYKDGGEGHVYAVSSISGDIELRRR